MPALETILGATKQFGESSIALFRVGTTINAENGAPLTTANFVQNGWAGNGYGVIERPGNLAQLLLDTVVKDEYERASLYVLELEERNEKETKRLEEWKKGEEARLEEYGIMQGLMREQADIIELVFDGLEGKGIKGIVSLRSQYRQYRQEQRKTKLSELRIEHLMTFLGRMGIPGYAKDDIRAIIESREPNNKDRTIQALSETLGVEIKADGLEAPVATNPPEVQIREIPPLLSEFEAVVKGSYTGKTLEGLNLTLEAWKEAGINPQQVYNKIARLVVPLGDQHLLVGINGKSEEKSGSLNLVQIISNPPKALRPYYLRPADIAYDAYALGFLVFNAIESFFEQDANAKNIIKKTPEEKMQFFKRAIIEEMFKGATPIAAVMFPNWHAVAVSDEEPYIARAFKEKYRKTAGISAFAQKWYASSIKQAELQQYRAIAREIVPEIKRLFAGTYSAINDKGGKRDLNSLSELVDVVKSLVNSVPREYFELMEADRIVELAEDTKKEILRLQRENMMPRPAVQLLYEMRLALGNWYQERIPQLRAALGSFFMKGTNEWQPKIDGNSLGSATFKYNIGTLVAN